MLNKKMAFAFIILMVSNISYADMVSEIEYLFPTAVNGKDYELQDDSNGTGPYIKRWNDSLGTKPTAAQLRTVEVAAEAAVRDRRKEKQLDSPVIKALIEALEDKFLIIRGELRSRTKEKLQ